MKHVISLLFLIPFFGISQTSHLETIFYSYDNLDRLIQVHYPEGSTYNYVYDNLGNRIQIIYDSTPSLELNEELLKNTITVYPNPTTNKITVEIPEDYASELLTVNVIDMKGKVIVKEQSSAVQGSIKLETTNLNVGVYLLTVSTSGESWSQLFIKK